MKVVISANASRKAPMRLASSAGPVTLPPENSVPMKSTELFQAAAAQTKHAAAWQIF
jgi:hypothetical protein